MAAFSCNDCKAIYSDKMADGSLYFHACGPIANPGFQPDPTKPNFDARPLIERPNRRDENVQPGLQFIDGSYVRRIPVATDPESTTLDPVTDISKAQGTGAAEI